MRQSPRFAITVPAAVDIGGDFFEGKIINLGLKGAFVALPIPPVVPPVVSLSFSPPQMEQNLEVLARVVRTSASGMGTEFLDLNPYELYRLWSSLTPLWPGALRDCPYCGHPFTSKPQNHCPQCRGQLDIRASDYLEKLEEADQRPREMIGTCDAMRQVFKMIRKVATSDVPVLVMGASGTGKEMVAQAIHQRSRRAKGPFVAVNCGGIPRELLESELFGHEKGAFTGAYRTVVGTVERAQGGTLFLDEVGELPLELQVKLLRFLQEYTFERVGGSKTFKADLRVISATNSDLEELIAAGRFREDLYYRLDVVKIELPPLKQRDEDVLVMANVFLRRYSSMIDKEIKGFTKVAATAIQTHSWPGNIRELVNRIRRGVVMSEGLWITPEHLGFAIGAPQGVPSGALAPSVNGLGLKEAKAKFEADLVTSTLERCQGNVLLTAKILKTSRSMVYHLIQKYNLTVDDPSSAGGGEKSFPHKNHVTKSRR
jgi:two-component system NtrC family response regulator